MMLHCSHCGRDYRIEDFSVKARERYVLLSGHPIRFGAYHRACGWTTLLQNLPVPQRDKIGATN